MNSEKVNIIFDYLDRIERIMTGSDMFDISHEIYDLLSEIQHVFKADIPEIETSILFRSGAEVRDANTVVGLLKMYLANNGIEYKKDKSEENREIKRFWSSFIVWFENELVEKDIFDDKYLKWDDWDGGSWIINIDYDYEFKLHRGINYPESLKLNTGDIYAIKTFIEIAYKNWVKNDKKIHYDFTVEINDRLKIFKLPYKLQNGILIKLGYKSTDQIDKIINYRMFERKIRFSEDMIMSTDLMEKKSALDFLIDSLQYLVSTQEGNRNEQYSKLSKMVNEDNNSKVYSVVKSELKELMKISNDYFDIRHNDYLNSTKEHREALNDSQFIEYLYNRAYSLLYLLRLKSCNEN